MKVTSRQGVTIRLDADEALALNSVLYHVGGSGSDSLVKLSDLLDDVGFRPPDNADHVSGNLHIGRLE